MEVTETVSDGLKREFQIQVPAADLEARVSQRLVELKDQVQLRGFRPGKVPVTHLKKIYGKRVMAETIDAVIRELNGKIVSERGLKLATEPKVTIPNEETEVEKLIKGQVDLAYTLAIELLPKIELADFKGIALERPAAHVTEQEVEEALGKLAEQNKPYVAKPEDAKVEMGDRVVIDFTGRVDGKPFEGGTGGDVGVNIGSNISPRLRGSTPRYERGRKAPPEDHIPRRLRQRRACRQGGRVRRNGQIDRSAVSGQHQ